MPMSSSTLRKAVETVNTAFDAGEAQALVEMLNLVNDNIPAATLTTIGGVKKSAAIADIASAIPATAPAGGTGTAAGGWDTAANRDAAIATINSLRTAVSELKTQYNSLQAAMRTAGFLTV